MANLENLKKVRETIRTHRQNFHYKSVFSEKRTEDESGSFIFDVVCSASINTLKVLEENSCGTCACIVGFCVALASAETSSNKPENGAWNEAWTDAEDWLDLIGPEARWLFAPLKTHIEQDERRFKPTHLDGFELDPAFPGYVKCTQEQGYTEALRRLDFLIEHYSKEEQNGGSI
jgi:hypothetical protein